MSPNLPEAVTLQIKYYVPEFAILCPRILFEFSNSYVPEFHEFHVHEFLQGQGTECPVVGAGKPIGSNDLMIA